MLRERETERKGKLLGLIFTSSLASSCIFRVCFIVIGLTFPFTCKPPCGAFNSQKVQYQNGKRETIIAFFIFAETPKCSWCESEICITPKHNTENYSDFCHPDFEQGTFPSVVHWKL